jgi:cellulose synthase/poly-beta-1,6-N-acetylglucosamine synthase-like glycosyltransferase
MASYIIENFTEERVMGLNIMLIALAIMSYIIGGLKNKSFATYSFQFAILMIVILTYMLYFISFGFAALMSVFTLFFDRSKTKTTVHFSDVLIYAIMLLPSIWFLSSRRKYPRRETIYFCVVIYLTTLHPILHFLTTMVCIEFIIDNIFQQ